MTKLKSIILILMIVVIFMGCTNRPNIPTDVQFKLETLQRIGGRGDNWCITWAKDGSQSTSENVHQKLHSKD